MVVSNFKHFLFSPLFWGRFPFGLIFFRWVETTNQFAILFSSYLTLSCLTHANVGRVKTTAPLNIYIVYVSRNPTYLNQMRSGQFTLLDHFYETCEQLILPVYNPYRFLLYAYLIPFLRKQNQHLGKKTKSSETSQILVNCDVFPRIMLEFMGLMVYNNGIG